MGKKATLGLAGNALQAHHEDEQTRAVVNIQQLFTPAKTSSGSDRNPSSGADRELQRGRTWNRGTGCNVMLRNTRDWAHDPSTSANRDRGCAPDEKYVVTSRTDLISCGGISRAGKDESRPMALAEQDKVQGIEEKSNCNVVDGGDECWDQAPATETPNACFFSSDTKEEVPPSPLPPAPVPLRPTAQQGSYFPRRLPPSRVPSASASLLFQRSEDGSRMWDPLSSRHRPICDKSLTLDDGNEAMAMKEMIAQHRGSGTDKVLPPPGRRSSESHPWDPVFGGSCHSIVNDGVVDHVSSQRVGHSPQPCRRPLSNLLESVLQRIKGQAGDHAPPAMLDLGEANKASSGSPSAKPGNTRTAFCNRSEVTLTTALGAHIPPLIPSGVGDAGEKLPLVHGAQDGLEILIPGLPTGIADEASPRAEHPRTAAAAAVLILQRWLRRVTPSSKREPPRADVAAQSIRESPTVKGFKRLQTMDTVPSAELQNSTVSFVGQQSKIIVRASLGASPSAVEDERTGHAQPSRPTVSRCPMLSGVEAGSLIPGTGNLLREALPSLRKDTASHALAVRALKPIHPFPRRRAFSVNDLEITPGDNDFVRTTTVPSSQDVGSNGEASSHSSNMKSAANAAKAPARTRTSYPRQGLKTRSLHGFGFAVSGRKAGADEAPKMGPLVSFSLPNPTILPPPLHVSSMFFTPVLPRVPPTGLLEAGKCNNSHISGKPIRGPRGCSRYQIPVGNSTGWSRVEGGYASASSGIHQDELKGQVVVKSAARLDIRGMAPVESRCEVNAGCGLTVVEACLNRDRCPGSRTRQGGPGFRANQRQSCCPDAVAMAAKVTQEMPFSRSHRERGPPSTNVVRAVSRHQVAVTSRSLFSNPLLHAWGVGNPLLNTAVLVRGSGTRCGTAFTQGVAPHS